MTSLLGEPTTLPVQDLIHITQMVHDLKAHYDDFNKPFQHCLFQALLPFGLPIVIKLRFSYKMFLLNYLIHVGVLPFTLQRSEEAINIFQQLVDFSIF
ncbi:unnamed protein product [Caenorhabditis brenneri]